jgi:hypothetical protein
VSRRHSLSVALLVTAGAGVMLGACSSTPASSASTTTAQTTTSAPTTTSGATTTVPFNEATNARSDVTTPSVCRPNAAGLWVWTGTVTNKGTKAHTYTIIVDFTDSSATVEQTKVVTVKSLAPGKTVGWTVDGAAGLGGILCVIRSARLS